MKPNTKLNRIYHGMILRCYDTNRSAFKDYGGRGITVCDDWNNREKVPSAYNATKGWLSFKEWAVEHGYKEGLTLDRIDNNKGYSPENCRWVTRTVQMNNTRRNRFVEYKGVSKTLSEWCRELELNYDKIERRINKLGWSVEKALETK